MAPPPKPPAKLLSLAQGALTKNPRNRTPQEKIAIRKTKPWRDYRKANKGQTRTTLPAPAPQAPAAPSFYETPIPLPQLQQQAGQLASSQLQPSMQEIARLQEQAIRQADQQANLAGGLAQGMGQMVQNIGPQIQQQYQQAAETQAGLARGFSGALEGLAQQEAAANAALLENVAGAPAEQIQNVQQQSQGAADPLYGTGGFIPATAMGREGAAMAAYGSTMPAVVARMGQQDAASARNLGQQQSGDLQRQAADLQAQLPGMTQQVLQQLIDREQAKFENNRQFQFQKEQFNYQKKQAIADFKLQAQAAKAAAIAAGIADKKWLAEFNLEKKKTLAQMQDMEFAQQMDIADLELDWAKLKASAAKDAQKNKDRNVRSQKAREGELKDLRSDMQRYAKSLVKESTRFGQTRTTRPPLNQALKLVKQAYASEIRQLQKQYGVKPARITQLIRAALQEAGWDPVSSGVSAVANAFKF
jgi:hypothetical protein